MIRWSFQLAHGCAPVAPRTSPSGSTSDASCRRRSARTAGTSANVSVAPRLDLDLGRDQLTGQVALESLSRRGRLDDVLEAVDELERVRVEERELLLDGDGEVVRSLESLPRLAQELVVRNSLCVAHEREL